MTKPVDVRKAVFWPPAIAVYHSMGPDVLAIPDRAAVNIVPWSIRLAVENAIEEESR
jgi:hypothetical protein